VFRGVYSDDDDSRSHFQANNYKPLRCIAVVKVPNVMGNRGSSAGSRRPTWKRHSASNGQQSPGKDGDNVSTWTKVEDDDADDKSSLRPDMGRSLTRSKQVKARTCISLPLFPVLSLFV